MASLLSNMAAAAQGSFGTILNFATGSIFAAINEGVASVMLWLQWLLVLLYLKIRAATATGTDLDSWMADFGVVREPAVAATGLVTFARFTSTASATVPVGATVLTGDLSQTFAVTANTTNSYYVAGSNSYLIPAGTASAALPVQAVVAGVGGNVLAGAISLSGSALAGIDTVTNAAPFTNGDAAETDPQLRSRFVTFVNTRAQATPGAIVAAIIGVQSNLIYSLFENVNSAGGGQNGNFVVVVDDGSGAPSSALLNAISTAIVTVRPICSTWSVVGPSVTAAAIAITITPPAGTLTSSIAGAIETAVATYVDSLPINNTAMGTTSAATLFLAQISGVVAGAAPSGTTVTTVTINGASANLVPANMGVVRASGVTVS
jgi:uncharacterized phage protein gp47/JayE